MPEPEPPVGPPVAARRILAIAVPATIALWLALYFFLPAPGGMADVGRRLWVALGWICLAAIFSLAAGIQAVAHERLRSSAFDPLAGQDSDRLRINQRYLQNTLEQFCLFAPGFVGLAWYADSDAAMRAVPATALTWIVMRIAFWIGYHHGAAYRTVGVPGLAIPLLLLLYVAARFANDLAGLSGAVGVILLFVMMELVLFRTTRAKGAHGGD